MEITAIPLALLQSPSRSRVTTRLPDFVALMKPRVMLLRCLSGSGQTRFNMRYGVLAVVLISAAALGGCSEGVLDPKGPIASAERQILFNSLGIMLAIVIPTILATLGVAFWFRSSNTRARLPAEF